MEIGKRLKEAGIAYKGPLPSHLGMMTIELKDAAGYIIKVNTPGTDSPEWLKEQMNNWTFEQ